MITYIVGYIYFINTYSIYIYIYYTILMYKTVKGNGNYFNVNTTLIDMVRK